MKIIKCGACGVPMHWEKWDCPFGPGRCFENGRPAPYCFAGKHSARVHDPVAGMGGGIECPKPEWIEAGKATA